MGDDFEDPTNPRGEFNEEEDTAQAPDFIFRKNIISDQYWYIEFDFQDLPEDLDTDELIKFVLVKSEFHPLPIEEIEEDNSKKIKAFGVDKDNNTLNFRTPTKTKKVNVPKDGGKYYFCIPIGGTNVFYTRYVDKDNWPRVKQLEVDKYIDYENRKITMYLKFKSVQYF